MYANFNMVILFTDKPSFHLLCMQLMSLLTQPSHLIDRHIYSLIQSVKFLLLIQKVSH